MKMIFDLSRLDLDREITEQLAQQHFKQVEDMMVSGKRENTEEKPISLFHGTSLYHINKILIDGVLPINETSISNYEGNLKSNVNLVYLTSKWHYQYAYYTFAKLNNEGKVAEDMNFPCYVECKIPYSELVIDEDFFHSKYILQKLRRCLVRGEKEMEVTVEECLNHYGTVAHLGRIKRKNIESFTILANLPLFLENFIDSKSQYQKDVQKWGKGRGKGELRFLDLLKLEDDKYNLTFEMKNIPEGCIITKFIKKNDNELSYSLVLS
jgi:hypothetical protein